MQTKYYLQSAHVAEGTAQDTLLLQKDQARAAQIGLHRGAEKGQETSDRVAGTSGRGCIILSGDEWASTLQPGNGHSWRRTGGDEEVKTSFSKKSVKAFCFVGEWELHVVTADAAN